ncbi:MAG: hypothetical protein U1G07_02890 [Verrucomicrobiota bacterium]
MTTLAAFLFPFLAVAQIQAPEAAGSPELWQQAKSRQQDHRFSTLFTAQDVRQFLSSEEGLAKATDWCKQTGVTKVYLESYRDGYQAEREVLQRAKKHFQEGGWEVSGCVTPTGIGKASSGWKTVSCYTDAATQLQVRKIFEFTAALFDQIMIDDFWFTDCTCPDCDQARQSRTVRIGERAYQTAGDTWEEYRGELMWQLSKSYVLAAAKAVNPATRLILKYPQWYDRFHERGYDVARETASFDWIWVGTESRDYNDPRWGGTPQYESYFIMRWLGGMAGSKCGGGWYDWLGTTSATYLEQARQTVLGGARESMLFCYGGLQSATGPSNVLTLRSNVVELLDVARQVRGRSIVGLAAYKPAHSHPGTDSRIFDFVGMLGFPLVPVHEFPINAPAAFFSIHALKDPSFPAKLTAFIQAGKPVLITDGLAQQLAGKVDLTPRHVCQLPVKGDPKSLLGWSRETIDPLRAQLLAPFQTRFEGPPLVSLYLFADGSWAVENFNQAAVRVRLNDRDWTINPRAWRYEWKP